MTKLWNTIICRYTEIATKKGNRRMFENCLCDNIKRLLTTVPDIKIKGVRGRIYIQHLQQEVFTDEELNIIRKKLPKAFGLQSFSPAVFCKPELEELKRIVHESSSEYFAPAVEGEEKLSFRIRARRSDKDFPLKSMELEVALAEVIGSKYEKEKELLSVDLENADITVGCEVRKEFAFIYYEIIQGPGGLPVGSNSPVLALISGGIDSPVACYMTMKRGCRVDFITFHSAPYTDQESVDKVKDLVKILNEYQPFGKLYICNLAPIQKLIRDCCKERFRTVLYRRMMFRIAERVAVDNKLFALLTGEAVGQVASQTIVNLGTINNSTDMLVLRPLLGMDKQEVVEMAREIETFEISKIQVADSCTVFAPSSPATKAGLHWTEVEEEKLGDYNLVLDEIINTIESLSDL